MQPEHLRNKFCKLCLCTIIDINFEPIEEVTEVLTIVLPGMDLEGEKGEHIICKTCFTKLFDALSFKSICLDTEDALFPYITSDDSVIDLKEVYLKEKENILLSDNPKICRLCFQLITSEYVSAYEVNNNIMVNYIPQVNINTTKEPVICGSCFESLRIHGGFLQNCREAIEKYVRSDEFEKNEIKVEENDKQSNLTSKKFKMGKNCFDVQEQYGQLYIKTEEVNIKAEDDEGSDFSSNDLSEGTNGNKELSEIIDESVRKREVRAIQVNECNPKMQESESGVHIISGDSKYKNKNELQNDSKPTEQKKRQCKKSRFETNRNRNLKQNRLSQKVSSKIQIYKCHECSFETKYEWCLNGHLSSHKDLSDEQKYKCDICSCYVKKKRQLEEHQLKHQDPSKVNGYMCHLCHCRFVRKWALRSHLLWHRSCLYKCGTCNFVAKSKIGLTKHQLMHKKSNGLSEGTTGNSKKEHPGHSAIIDESVRKCKVREIHVNEPKSKVQEIESPLDIPSSAGDYKNVLNSDSKDQNAPKPKINESNKRSETNQHSLPPKAPSEIKTYKCHACIFESRYEWCLNGHLSSHKKPLEPKPYKCDTCGYETNQKKKLKEHNLTHKNPSNIEMYKCQVCGYVLWHKKSIKRHLLRHQALVRMDLYKCKECNYSTKYKKYLKYHLFTHKDPSKPPIYECNVCDYKTKQKGHVKRHQMKHDNLSKVAMYECETCDYKTDQKQYLKRHMIKHKDPSEIKMYRCGTCDYATKYQFTLKRHLWVHRGSLEVQM